MSTKTMKRNAAEQLGMTLIELMVAMSIGLLLLGGVISVFISTLQSNGDNIRMIRLEQDLRATMGLITREIKLAGSWRGATQDVLSGAPVGNPYSFTPVINVGGTCIIFQYGTDTDLTLDDDETFGFRINANQIEYNQNSSVVASCVGAGWQPLTVQDASSRIDTFTVAVNEEVRITDVTVNLSGRAWLSGDDINDPANWSAVRTLNKTIRIRNN